MASASDDFNRANGGLGANWATVEGTALEIVSNRAGVVGGGGNNLARRTAETFAANHYSEATLFLNGQTDTIQYVTVRHQAGGDHYGIRLYSVGGTQQVDIYKYISTVLTPLQTITGALTDGGLYRVSVVGTTLKAYLNGVQIGTDQADASISLAGAPGFGGNGGAGSYFFRYFDDWAAADIASPRFILGTH